MFVVSYDIVSDRLRNKIAKVLEGYGIRIQYSVFECRISDKKYKELYHRLMELMGNEAEGNIRFYYLCGHWEGKISTIGIVSAKAEQITEKVIII